MSAELSSISLGNIPSVSNFQNLLNELVQWFFFNVFHADMVNDRLSLRLAFPHCFMRKLVLSSESPTKLSFSAKWTRLANLDCINRVCKGKRIDAKEGTFCTVGYVREINVTKFLEGVA